MLKKYSGVNQVTYEPVLMITNRYRHHYRRRPLTLTWDFMLRDTKPRPWLKLLVNGNLM
jgi:hypothetical protein